MTRTAPEMAAFLGVTPRQLALVFREGFGGQQLTGQEALDLASIYPDVELHDMVRVARARHPEVFECDSEVQQMKPLVIYHADCTDGFGAAFAAWLELGDGAEYYAAHYNDKDIPDWRGREVYILDFSFPLALMKDAIQRSKRVVWRDHHKTAFEVWCGSYEKGLRHEEGGFNATSGCEVDIILDDNKSGALLAWEYFHPDTEIPTVIKHIDDRDRWQFKLAGSKELHAALQSYRPWSFEQWKEDFIWLDPTGEPEMLLPACFTRYKTLLAEGAAVLRAQEQHVASMVKQARKCEIWRLKPGMDIDNEFCYPGLAVNAPIHMSEVGHELANRSGTYGLVWYMDADARVKCSLRSNGEYDVSAIARQFGGGGHRNAAGFETDINTLMGWLA